MSISFVFVLVFQQVLEHWELSFPTFSAARMLPTNGNSRLWIMSGKPYRRTLFVLLCFCMTYALFHFVSKESLDGPSLYEDELVLQMGLNGRIPSSITTQSESQSAQFLVSPSSHGPAVAHAPVRVPLTPSSSSAPSNYNPSLDSWSTMTGGINSLLGLTIAASSPPTSTTRSTWSDSEEPLIDKETKTIEELILEAAVTIRNIPLPPYILSKSKDGPKYYRNASCARFPTVYDLEFSNTFWQVGLYVFLQDLLRILILFFQNFPWIHPNSMDFRHWRRRMEPSTCTGRTLTFEKGIGWVLPYGSLGWWIELSPT